MWKAIKFWLFGTSKRDLGIRVERMLVEYNRIHRAYDEERAKRAAAEFQISEEIKRADTMGQQYSEQSEQFEDVRLVLKDTQEVCTSLRQRLIVAEGNVEALRIRHARSLAALKRKRRKPKKATSKKKRAKR